MKAEYIETLKKIVENGNCTGIECRDCPFFKDEDLVKIAKKLLDITD